MIDLSCYQYKVTYLDYLHCLAFVRISDDAILYSNANENYVELFAKGFCTAKNESFYIE